MLREIEETGRTMLEMLSVIVMMGLLTIGGLQWYGTAVSKMELNDLLNEVRKRALVVGKRNSLSVDSSGKEHFADNRAHRNVYTYGLFDAKTDGKGRSTYGYGVGDNQSTPAVTQGMRDGYSVVLVPVGEVHGGNALSKGVCKALLLSMEQRDEHVTPAAGSVIGVYKDSKNLQKIKSCDPVDVEGIEQPLPSILWIAVKA